MEIELLNKGLTFVSPAKLNTLETYMLEWKKIFYEIWTRDNHTLFSELLEAISAFSYLRSY